jgi:hypothetical protein
MLAKRMLLLLLIASSVVLVVRIGSGRASAPETGSDTNAIPYAGALTDPSGQPVADGPYDFSFALHTAEDGGEPIWSEVQIGVPVADGGFDVALGTANAIPADAYAGGARWLQVAVRGPGETVFTPLSPRQPLSVASTAPDGPTAALACPHDHTGEVWSANIPWSDGAFKVLNYANGPTLWGWNGGNGNGVRGYATGTGLGVYGESQNSAGVLGRSTTGRGVEGYTTAASQYGVFGKNESSGGGIGVVGYAPNGTGVGVLGEAPGFALYARGDLRVEGYSIFDGGKSGFVVDVAQNDDVVALEVGDVVAISGAGPAILGEIPVIKVRRATARQAGAIVGVVDKHFIPARVENADSDLSTSAVDDAAIRPGDYLTIVTLGAYKAIKVDASFGAVVPGDRLVASPNAGHAMRTDSPLPGTIIGKALEPLRSGVGVIPVIVTLQ